MITTPRKYVVYSALIATQLWVFSMTTLFFAGMPLNISGRIGPGSFPVNLRPQHSHNGKTREGGFLFAGVVVVYGYWKLPGSSEKPTILENTLFTKAGSLNAMPRN